MKVSICLPIHDMKNAEFFLERCLDSIISQSFEDFEVVIADNSPTDKLLNLITKYGMKIIYHMNPDKGMAPNTNFAIKLAEGEIIKVLYMDDYFAHKDALKYIVEAFKGQWLINGTEDNPYPYYTDDIHLGNNKLGSPSALAMLNGKKPMLFDEKMTWLLDCDLYKRLYDKYGEPEILDGFHVVIGKGDHQITHILTDNQKLEEEKYMQNKYA